MRQLAPHPQVGAKDGIAYLLDLRQWRAIAVLLQPQPVAQHFLHRLAHRVGMAAGRRAHLFAGIAQPRLQCVGGIQQLPDRPLTASPPVLPAQCPHRKRQRRQRGNKDDRTGQGTTPQAFSAVWASGRPLANRRGRRWRGLTDPAPAPNIPPLMSKDVPEILDAWRMVAARREFAGQAPLAGFERLRSALADDAGEVAFELEFDRDALKVPFVEVRVRASLPLVCQRSLQRFDFPLDIRQRLGLIRDESEEAALPTGYEPLLLPEDGMLHALELVEDELILAVPAVPVMPGTQAMQREWPASEEERAQANPFAALAGLKKNH